MKRLLAGLGAVVVLGPGGLAGCGTNLQAAYEGDVRFEHCIALDARAEVRSEIRRACWNEWVAFYTYGQTRDRLVHAYRRMRELGGGPASSETELADLSTDAPEPSADTSGPTQRCELDCRSVLDACTDGCDNRACQTACTAGYRSCARGCR
ncbi:MAG: hypothetical protein IT373_01670 [Polyangiaceae bacterium]|nr:hypothetical protein [Polyangiaceae bacterium]